MSPDNDKQDTKPESPISPDDMALFYEIRHFQMILIALHRLVRTRAEHEKITGSDVATKANELCGKDIADSTCTYALHELEDRGIATVEKGYKSHDWGMTDNALEWADRISLADTERRIVTDDDE